MKTLILLENIWTFLFKLFILLCVFSFGDGGKLKTFCYFTNWSNHLQSKAARFQIGDIDIGLCSHLIYAFAKINTDEAKLERSQTDDDDYTGSGNGRYFEFTGLKLKSPELVTLLSIGGASAGSTPFRHLTEYPRTMKLFAKNCAIFLRDRSFDGIDIDWEYPGDYKDDFTALLKIMRQEFDRGNGTNLLITIAVAAGDQNIEDSYNIKEISKYVDFIHVMSYDYHGPWSDRTGFSAPLFSRKSNRLFNQQLSQAWTMDRWLSGGAPPEKLVMGLTATALSFNLSDPSQHGVGAPISGTGKPGVHLQGKGQLSYFEACEVRKHWARDGADEVWDDEQKMEYAFHNNQWIGFPNKRSMRAKVDFAYSKHLAGVMFWSLDRDDFTGKFCHEGNYPLLNAIKSAIDEDYQQELTTELTTATTSAGANSNSRTGPLYTPRTVTRHRSEFPGSTMNDRDVHIFTCCSSAMVQAGVITSVIVYLLQLVI